MIPEPPDLYVCPIDGCDKEFATPSRLFFHVDTRHLRRTLVRQLVEDAKERRGFRQEWRAVANRWNPQPLIVDDPPAVSPGQFDIYLPDMTDADFALFRETTKRLLTDGPDIDPGGHVTAVRPVGPIYHSPHCASRRVGMEQACNCTRTTPVPDP